jgi:hypothetical protein
VDSGGQPTARPVRFDLFVDEKDGRKRLKRCDEHYTKFISELWFSVRECVETEQLRNLDSETLQEGCRRKFTKNDKSKIEVEIKDDMKQRVGQSPNKMDALAVGVEGARRLGFRIERIGATVKKEKGDDWLDKHIKERREMVADRQLTAD